MSKNMIAAAVLAIGTVGAIWLPSQAETLLAAELSATPTPTIMPAGSPTPTPSPGPTPDEPLPTPTLAP